MFRAPWTCLGFVGCYRSGRACVDLVELVGPFGVVSAVVLRASGAASVACDVVADHADLAVAFEVVAGSGFGAVVLGGVDGPLVDRVVFACEVGEGLFDVLEALEFLMTQHGLKQSDLTGIGSQGVVSEILTGKRDLNLRPALALSARFGLSTATFV
ncbi:MAG: hypothetical protein EBX55_12420 [Betaproteobacteria bacterium]|nr:hypothetical protein [Betaproteobacteria bacterium]